MTLGFGGLPGPLAFTFLDLYLGAQFSGTGNPKASHTSSCRPTNGVMCLALPLCSTILMERISSKISKDEQKDFFSAVDFHMYFRYDDMISATNMMKSRPFFPSSDQFLCLSHPSGPFCCSKYFSCSSRSEYASIACIGVKSSLCVTLAYGKAARV